jgi:glycolate oxidase FAD binding subunit
VQAAPSSDDADLTDMLADRLRLAIRRRAPLRIVGADSKAWLGRPVEGEALSVAGHRGIVRYQPEELVVTARAGTSLAALDARLREAGQWLPFDPPRFGGSGTLGGTIACGLSGPVRPFTGAARDFVLGVRVLNGRGQCLRFGGEVMKNVAGYDVSRLMTGAFGSLGVLLDISLKVLPAPRATRTLLVETDTRGAVALFSRLRRRPLPLAGAAWVDGLAHVRLAGSAAAVEAGTRELASTHETKAVGDDDDHAFWTGLRDHRLPFFDDERPLYRLSVAPARRPLELPGPCLIDWAGGQRWLKTDADLAQVRGVARSLGGHATRFRAGAAHEGTPATSGTSDVFHPLSPAVRALHERLKAAFDPHGILNPGRQYPGL